jgi:glycosyltransferase involved in cell wall biosynthesis
LGLPDTPLLIYHGVFMERKSIDWLIEATRDLLTERKFALLLVGDACRDESTTGYHRDLIAQTKDLAASNAVIFKGFQKDVFRYLQASDAYILPSTEEGLSNSLLEAMAAGLAPIVSNTSGTRELLRNKENGLTFGSRSKTELRAAIAWYLSIYGTEAESSLRAAARETIERDYSIDEIAKRYSSLYCRLADRTR